MRLEKGDRVRHIYDCTKVGVVTTPPKYFSKCFRYQWGDAVAYEGNALVKWDDGTRCRIDGAKLEVVK